MEGKKEQLYWSGKSTLVAKGVIDITAKLFSQPVAGHPIDNTLPLQGSYEKIKPRDNLKN